MRSGRVVAAALAVGWLAATAWAPPPAQAEPSAEEVKTRIAQLEQEYDALDEARAVNALVLEQAQAQLDQTVVQLAASEARLADLETRLTQVALYQWQGRDLSQSLALFVSSDSTTLMERLAILQQVSDQFDDLLEQYQSEQADLLQLRAQEEAGLTTIADRGTEMTQQMAELKEKTAEARNLLATVVSPRDVGANTGLTTHAIEVKQTLAGVFTEITNIGGYRAGDWGDHGAGRALDVMIPNYGSPAGVELGDTIARWCQDNARVLGVKYLIWRQRFWQTGWGVDSWQWMADRGSPTQNHYDHVHISLNE
ncbi:MAG: hypothetical protein LBK42_14695 [Propionibacteriaceae bacterium]|jgi:hypothetical protein|nr:hypothetical protein [Propionibacteriaceae bacterium]